MPIECLASELQHLEFSTVLPGIENGLGKKCRALAGLNHSENSPLVGQLSTVQLPLHWRGERPRGSRCATDYRRGADRCRRDPGHLPVRADTRGAGSPSEFGDSAGILGVQEDHGEESTLRIRAEERRSNRPHTLLLCVLAEVRAAVLALDGNRLDLFAAEPAELRRSARILHDLRDQLRGHFRRESFGFPRNA